MAIPASGPVSMSMLNVELGRSFNTANSALAGSSTPSIGSLFYLGAQSGSLNQTAPHAISEWYGYTTIIPQPTLKYDAYSSSYDGSVSVNLGSGGTTYNLNETGTVETGSGTNLGSNYYNINLPGTTTGYLTSSFSPVPSNTSFSISIMAFITGSSGQLFSIELATGNRLYIETNFVTTGVYDIRANLYSAGTRVVYLSGSINQNDWNHIVWVHDNNLATDDSKLYINNALAQSVTATNNISQTDAYQIRVGINILSTIVSYRLGSVSFWNGYYLAPLQIEDLYNEFYDRYVYVPV
jgi:hypothetical protein